MARRKASTDFEFGDIETILTVTSNPGAGDISATLMNSINGSVTAELALVVSVLARAINLVGLKPDRETERNSETPIKLMISGYTCELLVRLTLNVKADQEFVTALVAQTIGPQFASLAAQTLGFNATQEALQENPVYQKVMVQALKDQNHPMARFLSMPGDDIAGGQYL